MIIGLGIMIIGRLAPLPRFRPYLRVLWSIFGAAFALVGVTWEALGVALGSLGEPLGSLGSLGAPLLPFGLLWVKFRSSLGPLWLSFNSLGALLLCSWGALWRSLAAFGRSWWPLERP